MTSVSHLVLFHLCLFLFLFLGVFLAFLFHLFFSLSLTQFIAIFYCLNYTSLLLYLMTNTLHQIFFFHLLFSLSLRSLSAPFTVLITLRYYFISLQTLCITSFSLIYCFQYLYANYRHLLLSQLHFAFTSSHYYTSCNRFYNNYVINICPRQILWFI